MLSDWRFYALSSAAFASLTAIFGKVGVTGVPSNLATLIRTAVVLVLLSILVSAANEFPSLRHLSQRTWIFLVLSGLATGLSWLCYYRALQLGPVSKVAPVDKMSLALTVILSLVFLGETFSWKLVAGTGLILLGSIVLIL